jgi:hypothetical protein
MKKFYHLALCAIAAISLTGCFGGATEQELKLADLQGLWQRDNTLEFVRFTPEQSDENGYLYGREWNEDDSEDMAVYESDLIEAREKLGHPGNGWFKYKFTVTDGGLHEIHLMDNEGAEIPKEYIVSKLTSSELVYYEKDKENWKYSFTKVVETK